jgi:hypothetical protein
MLAWVERLSNAVKQDQGGDFSYKKLYVYLQMNEKLGFLAVYRLLED